MRMSVGGCTLEVRGFERINLSLSQKGGCPFKEEERQYEEEDKSKKARPPLSKSDLRKGFRQRRYESCLQAELLELPGPTSALELNVSSCCLARRGAKRRDVGTGR